MASSKDKDDSATDGDTSSDDEPIQDLCHFSEGEKVLAYHGPQIYAAKIQKVEHHTDERRYFVHYLGWNKNWDEWVGSDRLMKHTEENLQKQNKQGPDKAQKSGRSSQPKPKSSTDAKMDKEDPKNYVARGKKRKNESTIEKSNFGTEKMVKIPIPSTLKKQLVDDWELVTQQNVLVKLPRSPHVDDILKKYLEYNKIKEGKDYDSIGEIMNGLRCYFDKALPVILLYKAEREQYEEAFSENNVSPSTIYGAEHLLRLFVKLPELLACVNIEEETLNKLQLKCVEFLRFLQKNQSTLFLSPSNA